MRHTRYTPQKLTRKFKRIWRGDEKREWTHLAIGKWDTHFTPKEQGETTACGKSARRINATFTMDAVSCPRCLVKMKEDNWFCSEHGFIADANVTFEENCAICGRPVAW